MALFIMDNFRLLSYLPPQSSPRNLLFYQHVALLKVKLQCLILLSTLACNSSLSPLRVFRHNFISLGRWQMWLIFQRIRSVYWFWRQKATYSLVKCSVPDNADVLSSF